MTDINERMYGWLAEGVELRFGAAGDPEGELELPSYDTGPEPFVRVLIRARRRADRIEGLLQKAKRVQARLAADAREAKHAAQDKLDENLAAGAQNKREYSLGDERRAEANLKSIDEKIRSRVAERTLAVADEVVDGLKDLHWGLSGWRNDVRDIVRSFALESNLER